jgi:hypothetical protein
MVLLVIDFIGCLKAQAQAGPVLLVCFILDTIWGIKALVDIIRRRDYQASLALGAVAFVWVASFIIMRFVP